MHCATMCSHSDGFAIPCDELIHDLETTRMTCDSKTRTLSELREALRVSSSSGSI